MLRFSVAARESVIVGQALGAVVTAAVDLLTRCISERNDLALFQLLNRRLVELDHRHPQRPSRRGKARCTSAATSPTTSALMMSPTRNGATP